MLVHCERWAQRKRAVLDKLWIIEKREMKTVHNSGRLKTCWRRYWRSSESKKYSRHNAVPVRKIQFKRKSCNVMTLLNNSLKSHSRYLKNNAKECLKLEYRHCCQYHKAGKSQKEGDKAPMKWWSCLWRVSRSSRRERASQMSISCVHRPYQAAWPHSFSGPLKSSWTTRATTTKWLLKTMKNLHLHPLGGLLSVTSLQT